MSNFKKISLGLMNSQMNLSLKVEKKISCSTQSYEKTHVKLYCNTEPTTVHHFKRGISEL